MPRKALSIHEFAESLGVHYMTIWRACKRGEISWHKVGRRCVIPISELDRLTSKNE